MYLNLIHHDEQAPLPAELLAFLERDFHQLSPFAPLTIEFCQKLSQIFSAHNDPDIAALGFWLRPAHVHELKKQNEARNNDRSVYTSRGLAFHITASNVDTLFVYSWILSLLAGNGNVVRVPTKQSKAIEDILSQIRHLVGKKQFISIAQTTCLIRYEHQKNITAALSAHADIRIVWGSNPTIEAIRSFPLNPYGKEISFPDRFSYAAIAVESYKCMSSLQKERLAAAFFRDAYSFDQHACSSPRMIYWVGDPESILKISIEFYQRLQAEIERRCCQLPLSDILHKQTSLYALCAHWPVHSVNRISNELTIVSMHDISAIPPNHPGGGLFYHAAINDLEELAHFAAPHEQTLTFAGFESLAITHLAQHLNGRGPKRFVPIGEAMNFTAEWDGLNLLEEFSSCIAVTASPPTNEVT